MSYVPATFTAGFALMLTAAGAIGGQWVSGLQQALNERPSVKTEVRSRIERGSTAPTRRAAVGRDTSNALVTIDAIETLELRDLQMPVAVVPTLHAPEPESPPKIAAGDQIGKSRSSPEKKKPTAHVRH